MSRSCRTIPAFDSLQPSGAIASASCTVYPVENRSSQFFGLWDHIPELDDGLTGPSRLWPQLPVPLTIPTLPLPVLVYLNAATTIGKLPVLRARYSKPGSGGRQGISESPFRALVILATIPCAAPVSSSNLAAGSTAHTTLEAAFSSQAESDEAYQMDSLFHDSLRTLSRRGRLMVASNRTSILRSSKISEG